MEDNVTASSLTQFLTEEKSKLTSSVILWLSSTLNITVHQLVLISIGLLVALMIFNIIILSIESNILINMRRIELL